MPIRPAALAVCTENLVRVADVIAQAGGMIGRATEVAHDPGGFALAHRRRSQAARRLGQTTYLHYRRPQGIDIVALKKVS
jgi:hypothetical protein